MLESVVLEDVSGAIPASGMYDVGVALVNNEQLLEIAIITNSGNIPAKFSVKRDPSMALTETEAGGAMMNEDISGNDSSSGEEEDKVDVEPSPSFTIGAKTYFFTISPSEGIINPGEEVVFLCRFNASAEGDFHAKYLVETVSDASVQQANFGILSKFGLPHLVSDTEVVDFGGCQVDCKIYLLILYVT
jgi:hypothetical protein